MTRPAPDAWQAALDTLYGLANFETRPPGTAPPMELERIRSLLSDLGNPQLAWPAVHVAGTNGKGSTCAYVASMLRASGYRVGLFTSPHLHTVRERIQLDGELVTEAFVIEWLAAHGDALKSYRRLTTFEVLTALACSAFAADGVDIAVIEVGLGGRLDTTRVVEPVVSVLTPIDLDHTEILGDTVAAIAADKAGIMRGGVPVVCAPQTDEALTVVRSAAAQIGAPFFLVGEHTAWTERLTPEGSALDVALPLVRRGGRAPVGPARTLTFHKRLPGEYQAINLATAASVAWVLAGAGWDVPDGAIVGGAATTEWPARFHSLPTGPTSTPGVTVLIDGAHNPAGARALAGSLGTLRTGGSRRLIIGVSRDKDLAGILDALLPEFDSVCATASRHPRSMPFPALKEAVAARGSDAGAADDPAAALDAVLAASRPGDLIVAAGSLFVAAAVQERWLELGGLPLPPRDGPPHG